MDIPDLVHALLTLLIAGAVTRLPGKDAGLRCLDGGGHRELPVMCLL